MDVQIKMATRADYPKLVEFWNRYAGWDEIDQQVWEMRFVHTPAGPSEIALAFLDDELVGQMVLIPYRGKVGSEVIRMYRPFAAVIAPDERLNNMGILNAQLYLESVRYLTEQQAELIYVMPDPRWEAFSRRYLHLKSEYFPLYSRQLSAGTAPELPDDYQTELIAADDERIDQIWEKAAPVYPVSLVRDRLYFRWKSAALGYELFLVKQKQETVGLFALINKGNDTVSSIAEVLSSAATEQQRITILGAVCESWKRKTRQTALQKVGILATARMIPILEDLDFQPDDYTYVLAVHPLQERFREQLTDINNWHFSAGD